MSWKKISLMIVVIVFALVLLENTRQTRATNEQLKQVISHEKTAQAQFMTAHHSITTQLKANQDTLQAISQTLDNIRAIQNTMQSQLGASSIGKGIAQQIEQALASIRERLNDMTAQSTQNQDVQRGADNIAQGYHIWGYEPYGAVIKTPDNRFIIARVGKPIDQLGIVEQITQHTVTVGPWIIRK